eukprot:TRINITY_DN91777_c0_g1_i1.p1 TRINITY_DN91777_c0_g1~~TRINITY_DN91777_c0_g1_i1.p1  ORF type:complete len:383 (+),score=70.98 TRINITY_DN91777_c0_g1_i1:189-1337(+)
MYAPSHPSKRDERASQPPGASHGYTKVREIGQGSYGKATLVQDAEGKLYVMKTIDMSAMDKKQRRDAINEVRVLSFLKHPYIVSYRESFSENSTLAIVMDYADGGDLYQRISSTRKSQQSLSERTIMRWFTEAALALKYMHDKHVLHRDLKSQNLFLTSSDRLRVGDFGISKVLENTAAFARTAIGTPYYLSPEICQEKQYSFPSDMWALGCVLYEMAALKVPFDAQNLQALVQKIVRGPMPPVPPTYTGELKQLCWDLLCRDQAQRPSATDVIQRRYVQDEIRRMLHEERSKVSHPHPQAGHPPSMGDGSSVGGQPNPSHRGHIQKSYRTPGDVSDIRGRADGGRAAFSPSRGPMPQPAHGMAPPQHASRAPSPGSHRRFS